MPIAGPSRAEKSPPIIGWRRNSVEAAITQVLNGSTGRRDTRALIVTKDEQFVLDDRRPYSRAELILFERIPRLARKVVFPAVGVQVRVLQDLEQNAVNLVAARFQADVENSTGSAPILRTRAVRDHLHVADRFH